MSNLNRWEGIGRLGQEIELRYLSSGDAVINFSIAVDDSYKDKTGNKVERTEWVRCVAFGKTAGYLVKWLHKGKRILAVGKLKTREWEKDGQKHYTTEIHLHQGTEIIDWPERDAQSTQAPRAQPAPRPAQPASASAPQPDYDSFDDDIPFDNPYRGRRCLVI